MKIKKLLLVLLYSIAFLAVLYCVVGYIEDSTDPNLGYIAKYLHEPKYFRVMGVKSFTDKDFLDRYGTPGSVIRREREDGASFHITYQYDKFNLYLVEYPSRGEMFTRLRAIEIFDASYRFGRLDIGVGSTREQVEFAYKQDRELEQSPVYLEFAPFYSADAGYAADNWNYVLFCYDENDVVSSMIYRLGEG